MYYSSMDKKSVLKKILNKGKDVASTALSYAVTNRIASEARTRKADSLTKLVKQARSYDGAPNFNDDGSVTDAFKVRSVKDGVLENYKRRIKAGKPGFSGNPFSSK